MPLYDPRHVREEGIRLLPPTYPLLALLGAGGLHAAWPLAAVASVVRWAGALLALMAAAAMAWAIVHQVRRGTDPNPWKDTKRLVIDGPYQWSRNPIYGADLVLQAGLGLALGLWWAVVLLPATWACLRFLVIAKEERHLQGLFGPEYAAYKAKVRRWL